MILASRSAKKGKLTKSSSRNDGPTKSGTFEFFCWSKLRKTRCPHVRSYTKMQPSMQIAWDQWYLSPLNKCYIMQSNPETSCFDPSIVLFEQGVFSSQAVTSIIMTGGRLVTNDGAVYHSVPIILSHIIPKAARVRHPMRQCGPANHGPQHPHCSHYLHKSAPHSHIGTSSKYLSDTSIALHAWCKLS